MFLTSEIMSSIFKSYPDNRLQLKKIFEIGFSMPISKVKMKIMNTKEPERILDIFEKIYLYFFSHLGIESANGFQAFLNSIIFIIDISQNNITYEGRIQRYLIRLLDNVSIYIYIYIYIDHA